MHAGPRLIESPRATNVVGGGGGKKTSDVALAQPFEKPKRQLFTTAAAPFCCSTTPATTSV